MIFINVLTGFNVNVSTRFICQAFQSSGNSNPKYNITGSVQWSQEKANIILDDSFGFTLTHHMKD